MCNRDASMEAVSAIGRGRVPGTKEPATDKSAWDSDMGFALWVVDGPMGCL